MLKNYFEIDENKTVSSFLKDLNDKKNSQYIILEGEPKYFVDVRSIALKIKNIDEKLKNLKRPLSIIYAGEELDYLEHIIETGDRVIGVDNKYFDFIDALKLIIKNNYDFLNTNLSTLNKKEIFALNSEDKISHARNMFIKNRVNILPVIDETKIVGEIRPIDLLVNELFDTKIERTSYNSNNEIEKLWNLPVSNFSNKKPHKLDYNLTIADAVNKMIEKNLPSIIISDGEELYSIISYKDVFKLVKKNKELSKFNIEYNGISNLYDDELDLIKIMAEKTMLKITKISNYDNLKLSFKTYGNTEGTHKHKMGIKLLLSKGNKIINVDKEISKGTNDETYNDRVNINWNTPSMVQEALLILQNKVKNEKNKKR